MEKQKPILTIKEQEFYQRVNPDTGEVIGDIINADVVIKEIPRTGFSITYLATIISLIDNIGNKKMQVVKYILQNMNPQNMLIETVREISKKSGCSPQTVNQTLQLLERCGIVARKSGCVMLTPKLIHKGNAQKEKYLLMKFNEIKNSTEDDNN